MRKIIVFTGIMLIFGIGLCYAQGEEEITITTYYPSPYGVYGELAVDRDLNNNATSVTGLNIDIDESGTNTGTVTGLNVDVSGVATGTRYAATFLSGNVGIGTANPTSSLYVRARIANLQLESTGTNEWAGITLWPNGTSAALLTYGRGPNGNNLYFWSEKSGAGRVMTLTPSGELGIGRVPLLKFEVEGNAAKTLGGTAWVDLSDRRVKNILGKVNNGLEMVKQLNPIRFEWNEYREKVWGKGEEGTKYGFVGQELREVIPEFISEGPEGYLMYNPSGFEAILTAAIQEQQKEIEILKAEIRALEARLSAGH